MFKIIFKFSLIFVIFHSNFSCAHKISPKLMLHYKLLSVDYYNSSPFIVYDENIKQYSGIEYNLVKLIANKLNKVIHFKLIKPLNASRIHRK